MSAGRTGTSVPLLGVIQNQPKRSIPQQSSLLCTEMVSTFAEGGLALTSLLSNPGGFVAGMTAVFFSHLESHLQSAHHLERTPAANAGCGAAMCTLACVQGPSVSGVFSLVAGASYCYKAKQQVDMDRA